MKILKKSVLFLFIAIFILEFTACSSGNKKINTYSSNTEENIKFSEIMALSKEGNEEKIYSIKDTDLKEEGILNNVSNIKYNRSSNITVYSNIISQGTNLTKNYIRIFYKDKNNDINSQFSYKDLTLSPSGREIAFRSFSKDSPFSANGLSVYDTYTGKNINFDKDVIVSGDLYRWSSGDNLLYYGVEAGEKGFGKIYNYDFQNCKRKIIFDKFNGYCTFFAPVGNENYIYIENDFNSNNMYYYDSKNNKSILLGNTIDKVDNYIMDNKNNIIYFIARDSLSQENSIYKLTLGDKSIKRITYDFPKIVDETGGMAVDDSGKLYFCGLDDSSNGNNIYMYLSENNSVNLITNKSSLYHIIQDSR